MMDSHDLDPRERQAVYIAAGRCVPCGRGDPRERGCTSIQCRCGLWYDKDGECPKRGKEEED